jgi:DNA repair protein RecO (recombination protein O)
LEWNDDAIVLEARTHGETGAVARLLTREHGLHAGLVQGGAGARGRGLLQPGNRVVAKWRARLPEHLGTYTLELAESHAAGILDDKLRLSALQSACAVIAAAMPEREPHPAAFYGFEAWLGSLAGEGWDAGYVAFELGLLAELGFGLELDRCAATGARSDLTHVSPRTGRAVSAGAAAPFRDRLLKLPGFLVGAGPAEPADIVDGLVLAGHFLARSLFAATHSPLPAARERFIESYRRYAANPVTGTP